MSKKELVDMRHREIPLGNRVRTEEDIPSENGMLYKHTIVRVTEINYDTEKIRVTDNVGKVWWISPNQVSASFL